MNLEIINVNINKKLKKSSYPIFVGNNCLIQAGELLKKYINNKKLIVIHDDFFSVNNKPKSHFDQFIQSIKKEAASVSLIAISGGDKTKTMSKLTNILENVLSFDIDRDTLLIAFGGGVVGDIVGFASSILLRGLNFIQIPTTLLSQVDSSVGGKTGVNGTLGKNLIGTFHQPLAVIADTSILKSLPRRELRAGFSEVIKYGLIKDKSFFIWLEDNYQKILNFDNISLNKVIITSCSIKSDIIQDDEKEMGKRALLNLGHTFGHAIESIGNHDKKIIHGEAVSIGICMAFSFSKKLGFCLESEVERVKTLFKKSGLPTSIKDIPNLLLSADEIFDKFKYDKKTKNNKLTFILNNKIGESFIKKDVNTEILKNFLTEEI
jgi:3-dehydroquinate synthase|tara:strand:+ start:1332 stop:2465 length:1134 start_codon:yes stop_codon:yes gene_type:complete